MQNKLIGFIIFLALGAFVGVNSLFVVPQTQYAIKLRLGDPVETYTEPGLKFKVPFLDEVRILEKRAIKVSTDQETLLTGDQKYIQIKAYVVYKISDPLKFYKAATSLLSMQRKLLPITQTSIRGALGQIPLIKLLSPERDNVLKNILATMRSKSNEYGIDILDIRITHADLPTANADSIYRRMRSDRQVEAKQLRAEGAEEATVIRSSAEKQRVSIIAEAERQAQILRGEADAKAAKIYADAFGQDKDLYEYIRALEAYEKALQNENTTLMLSTNNKFFGVLNK